MKLLFAAITFGITIGGLVLFEYYKTRPQEENYAQIVQGLANQTQSKTPTPKPVNKSGKIVIKTPTLSAIPSSIVTSTSSLPPATPTPLSTLAPMLTPTPTITHTPEPTPIFTPTPTPQPTQQNDEITVVSIIPSPVKQNDTVKLDIKTTPQAQCSIKVILPSGSQSSAKGLEDKTADSSGVVAWSWKINWNTTPGTANIDITCSKDGQDFSKSLQMIIIER